MGQIISQEGYNKLKEELDLLSTVKRREIANRIEVAKELGDLSENAEYADAKDAQAFNEGRIGELTNLLKNLTVVDNVAADTIGMGSQVVAETGGVRKEFTIVSFNEADPLTGKISNESPLGLALLDRRAGDRITVKTPRGEVEYQVLEVK